MKVTLDLSRLLHEGAISREEHDRLARLGRADTGMMLVNVLVGFGVFAVVGGAVALVPTALTGIVVGAALLAVGIVLVLARATAWAILANICILVAALMLGAGIILLTQGVLGENDEMAHDALMSFTAACLLVAALFAGSAALARSSLLAVLTVLMLFAVLGSRAGYAHAIYELEVRQPLATVVLFSILALAAHLVSLRLARVPGRHDWARLATAVARTAVFLVNLGFWIGSLWGDDLNWLPPVHFISAGWFSAGWAVALTAAAVWAGRTDRRWLLNLVAVFGGIHFYTQWFERLGATPASVLTAGVLVLVFAVALWRLNRRPATRSPA